MAYTVLARRYRSTSFGEVVGQESIAKTLLNALSTGRVAHAYLFTGTRGVGKTSMARILARALNAPDTIADCPKLMPDDEYPDQEVQQRMADAIMRGDDLNVIEIDGASNNSVDDARDLIANAGLAPTGNALFKIYIIDEVHMLTKQAFNALLKTMEEPPSHVKFILCTTETHKVLATIQSRCQRFDFRNIPTSAIAEHLGNVLSKEGIEADSEVLWQIARLGNGSMRDSLSLLDRLIATAADGETITPAVLEQMLGLPPADLLTALVEALAGGDVAAALEKTAALLNHGIAQEQLIDVLIERLRQLMLISVCSADSELVELSDEARKAAAQQAEQFDAAGLVHMIALCENLQQRGRHSSSPRALLDATVVRLALSEKMADVAALVAGGAGVDLKKKAGNGPVAVNGAANTGGYRAPGGGVMAGSSATAQPAPPAQPSAVSLPAEKRGDVKAVWAALLEMTRQQPAMSWINSFELKSLDAGVARLVTRPGKREMLNFANGARCEQLAGMLGRLLDQRVRVEVSQGEAVQGDESGNSGRDGGGQAASGRMAQRDALSLPLVKQVLDVFDATLVDARVEEVTPTGEQEPGDDESLDGEDTEDDDV